MNSEAHIAVALPGGKVFVQGYAMPGIGEIQNVYVMYNADGSLDKSFGNNGLAIQTVARTRQYGDPFQVFALGDGSVLLDTEFGVRRLTPQGTWDEGFGKNGLAKWDIESLLPQADGTSVAQVYTGGKQYYMRLNLHGATLRSKPAGNVGMLPVIGSPALEATNWSSSSPTNLAITIRNADQSPRTDFADNGTLALTPIIDAWAKNNGPWYDGNGKSVTNPYISAGSVLAANDGGYVIAVGLYSRKAVDRPGVRPANVPVSIHISRTGQLESINASNSGAAVATITGGDSIEFGGTVHYGDGPDQTFAISGYNGTTIGYGSVYAGNGIYFAYGFANSTAASPEGTSPSHFMVARIVAAGSISGVLFNDHDLDGNYDAGETVNAGRAVYIDANNNGKLDAGEDVAYSDANGKYTFRNVSPGKYTVRRVLPNGYKLTTQVGAISVVAGTTRTWNIGSVAV